MGPVRLRSVVLESVALDAIYLWPTSWETLLYIIQNFTGFLSCYSLLCFFLTKISSLFRCLQQRKERLQMKKGYSKKNGLICFSLSRKEKNRLFKVQKFTSSYEKIKFKT